MSANLKAATKTKFGVNMLNVLIFNGNRLEFDIPSSFVAGETPKQKAERKDLYEKTKAEFEKKVQELNKQGINFNYQININKQLGREYFADENDYRFRKTELHSMGIHNFLAMVFYNKEPWRWVSESFYNKLIAQKA